LTSVKHLRRSLDRHASPGCTVVPALGVVGGLGKRWGRLPTVTLVVVEMLNAPGSVTVKVGVKVVTLGVTYW
jgi:hypothetical protein